MVGSSSTKTILVMGPRYRRQTTLQCPTAEHTLIATSLARVSAALAQVNTALRSTRTRDMIAAVPERVVLVVTALALAAGVVVSVGQHRWWTVLPLAAVLIIVAWRPLAPRPAGPEDARGAAIAVGGTLAWTFLNIVMSAEYLLVVRDPGFLTLSGMWLVDHPSTDIPAAGAVEAAALQANLVPDATEAWNLKGDVIQPQGAKMLPATIAIGGWIAGDAGVLAANAVIGGAGILAVYALARRFLGPMAALAPAGALAMTVAHIGLSRPAYSEPLTLLLVIAGILWAWRGVHQRSLPLLVAAAVASGATTWIRIDGAAFAIGALGGVAVALALDDAARSHRRRALFAFTGVQALTLTCGYLSLYVWSTEYLERLQSEAGMLAAVYTVLVLAVALWLITWTARWKGDRLLRTPARRLGRRGAIGVGVAASALMVVLASRPLWMTSHRGTETSREQFTNSVVEGFQRSQGLPIDPTRTYAESTVTWLSYYLTWPLVVLGIIGLGVAAYRMVRRQGGWAVFLGAVMAPSLMYLIRPSIVPDQLWAIRRFEPATVPGMLLAAAAGGWALVSLVRNDRARHLLRRTLAIAMVALPVTTWISIQPGAEYPVTGAVNVTTREMAGAREQLDELCALAPGHPIVLVGTSSHFGSLRVTCDVPVVLALVDPRQETLAQMTTMWDEPPVVLTRDDDAVTWSTTPTPVVSSTVRHSGYSLQSVPTSLITRQYDWYAGLVLADGTVEPLVADSR